MSFHTSIARKIGVTTRSVSGVVPDIGSFESSLERDFMELMRFEPSVERIIPQPLTIGYFDKSGQSRKYTPDGLIVFSEASELAPILYEIKYRDDFRLAWKTYMPKFRAAKELASTRGWHFNVYTEKEIRTAYLENIKFLWPYKNRSFDEAMKGHVLTILSDLEEADPEFLIAAIFSNRSNQAKVIPVIWHLVARGQIGCDLSQRLTMHSKLWTKEDL